MNKQYIEGVQKCKTIKILLENKAISHLNLKGSNPRIDLSTKSRSSAELDTLQGSLTSGWVQLLSGI